MERGAHEYSQSGLHSPFPSAFSDTQSEELSADHSSAAQYASQEARPNTYSASATPTSEYGIHPASARSGSFPEHIQRQQYYPASNHSGSSGGMAQSTSPSMPLQDGRTNHHNNQLKSDSDVPIDPSIAASSPTYPQHGGQYSPYPPQQEMSHGYPQHPGGPMYAQPRPDWAGYGQHPQHGMPAPYPTTGVQTPTSAAPAGARPGQVSTFFLSVSTYNFSRTRCPNLAPHATARRNTSRSGTKTPINKRDLCDASKSFDTSFEGAFYLLPMRFCRVITSKSALFSDAAEPQFIPFKIYVKSCAGAG
jgi:hypothetical protein